MGKRRKNVLVELNSSESDSGSNIESNLWQDFLSLVKKRKKKTSNTQKPPALSETSDSESEANNSQSMHTKSISSKEDSNDSSDEMQTSKRENLSDHEDGEVSDSEDNNDNKKCSQESDNTNDLESSSSSSSESSSYLEFDDGYDENLMGDEEDRKRLSCLSEKERETEIFKRIEQRDIMRTRWKENRSPNTSTDNYVNTVSKNN